MADGLRALENDAEALRAENEALTSAEAALRLVRANYEAGVATLQSRLAAAKASVIRDVIESVETEDYLLEEWIEDD